MNNPAECAAAPVDLSAASFDFTIKEKIAFLEFKRPPKNEIDSVFFRELADLCPALAGLEVKGLVLSGRGRHFSSGANLSELKSVFNHNDSRFLKDYLVRNVRSFSSLENLPFPVVAAISGCCLGVGLELALVCHYRIAAPNAVFSLPETTFGIIPGCGGCIRLPNLINPGRAAEFILSGRTMLADEAKSLGLVDYITERENLVRDAEKLINSLSGP